MKCNIKGISLISVIITVLVIAILAAVMIPSGLDKINNAKLTSFNENILALKQEANTYLMQNDEYPAKIDGSGNPVVYSITGNSNLVAEATKKGEQNDTFYVIDLDKVKLDNRDIGVGKTIDDFYIIAKTSGNVYYAKGVKVGSIVYYTKQNKGDGVVEVVPTSAPTPEPYSNPIIPEGFKHIGSETWDNGFTIQDFYDNQFVWVPALAPVIHADGTLDNTIFNSRFGRRRYRSEDFEPNYYYETNDIAFQGMTASVNKYGGFYIAKYEASNSGGKGQSKPNTTPWVNMTWNDARIAAEAMDSDWKWDTSAESYLCYGAHWDTVLEWLIDSTTKNLAEVATDSITWGNYTDDTFSGTGGIGKTGQWSQTNTKGIYDLAGNVWEWTMENRNSTYRVIRGGSYTCNGGSNPAAARGAGDYTTTYSDLGWRAVLYIK